MITTIQACEERLDTDIIKDIVKRFNAIVHVDKRRKNAFWSFKDMLDYEVDDYRLHLQDDVIIADDLELYIPILTKLMEDNNIDLLSLFAPARKNITKNYFIGSKISGYNNYIGNQGCIFSKKFVDHMRLYIKISSQTNDDDIFINEVLSRTSTKGYLHLPTLVQHDLKYHSLLKHITTDMRTNLFEKDFVIKMNLKK